MKYILEFTKTALSDIERHKKSGDKVILKKLKQLLNELMEDPQGGTGHPELLKNEIEGIHSRRINKKHRLVYRVDEEEIKVIVISVYSHYGDK